MEGFVHGQVGRVREQGHVPEDVVENVGLLEGGELLRGAHERAGRELPVGEHREEGPRGDQPRHGDDLPPGRGSEVPV